jgi:hypothetical protein
MFMLVVWSEASRQIVAIVEEWVATVVASWKRSFGRFESQSLRISLSLRMKKVVLHISM